MAECVPWLKTLTHRYFTLPGWLGSGGKAYIVSLSIQMLSPTAASVAVAALKIWSNMAHRLLLRQGMGMSPNRRRRNVRLAVKVD